MPILSFKLDEKSNNEERQNDFQKFLSQQPKLSIDDLIDVHLQRQKEGRIENFIDQLTREISEKGWI